MSDVLLLCWNILIRISVQTHTHIRTLYISGDTFSAKALHDFFGLLTVRVSVSDYLLRCVIVRLECMRVLMRHKHGLSLHNGAVFVHISACIVCVCV